MCATGSCTSTATERIVNEVWLSFRVANAAEIESGADISERAQVGGLERSGRPERVCSCETFAERIL